MKLATHASLFSGIGGIDLGLELAGLRTLWQSEVEPFCLEVLEARFPEARQVGSAAELPDDLERPDVLSGGFPCQPVSDAGLKLAQDDPRWLWPLFRDAVDRLRPPVVVAENVRGLRARGLGAVVGDLADLGYAVEWDLIPAAAVGAPHLRERFLIVAWEDGKLRNLFGPHARASLPSGWEPEPDVPRLLREVSRRRERLTALGNAVVSRVAWWLGDLLLAAEPDELVWGRALAVREEGEWLTPRESFLGEATQEPFGATRWPNAGQVRGGVALSAARTVNKPMRARWKTPTSAPWSGAGGGGPLYMDVAEDERSMIPTPTANEPMRQEFERYVDGEGRPVIREDGSVAWGERWYDRDTGQIVQRGLVQYAHFFPTPQAADGERTSEQLPRHYETGENNPTLLGAARQSEGVAKLLPTPVAQDAASSRAFGDDGEPYGEGKRGPTLLDAARDPADRRWPTPQTAGSSQRPRTREAAEGREGFKGLADEARAAEGGDGPRGGLNPAWVEWLMGFPQGWTDV